MTPPTRPRLTLLALAASAALALTGCNLVGGGSEEEGDPSTDSPGTSLQQDEGSGDEGSGDQGDDDEGGDDS